MIKRRNIEKKAKRKSLIFEIENNFEAICQEFLDVIEKNKIPEQLIATLEWKDRDSGLSVLVIKSLTHKLKPMELIKCNLSCKEKTINCFNKLAEKEDIEISKSVRIEKWFWTLDLRK